MARIFMDGFELGDLSLWSGSSAPTAVNVGIVAGMSGANCCTVGSGSIEKTFSSTKTELYIAFKLCTSSMNGFNQILSFKDSNGTTIACLYKFGTNYLGIYRGNSNGTYLATGTTYISSWKTYLIEIRYKPLDSGGVFTIKVDGVTDINYSGDTTSGLENILKVRLGDDPGGVYFSGYFDDFIVDDANWIGNTKLGIITPNGTGTTNNWTASAGTAYQCIDELAPSDTDYVYSNTVDQISTYAMTTIANMNSVKSIQLQGRAAYEGSPTPTKIQLGVRASGTDYFATDLSPGVGFGMLTKILELNPADSAAWEQADIDALEIGVKATA